VRPISTDERRSWRRLLVGHLSVFIAVIAIMAVSAIVLPAHRAAGTPVATHAPLIRQARYDGQRHSVLLMPGSSRRSPAAW